MSNGDILTIPAPDRDSAARTRFARKALVAIVLVTFVASMWAAVWSAAHVFLLAFAGILMGVLLRSLTNWFSARTTLPEIWALVCVLLGLLLVAVLAVWWLAPRVVQQIDQLSYDLPRAIDTFQENLRQSEWGRRLLEQAPLPQQLMPRRDVLAGVTGIFSTTLGLVVDALVILFVGIYLAAAPALYRGGVVRLVPVGRRARAASVLSEIGLTLQSWLAGRLVLMGLNGVVTTLGLWLLGVPLALTLGLLSALLNFVPNLGPIAAAVPAVLLAATQSWSQALSVVILYVAYQSLDGYLLTPLMDRRTVSLPPALVILAQVLLGVLLGGFGLVLASPLTAAALVLVRMLYVEDVLEHSREQFAQGGTTVRTC